MSIPKDMPEGKGIIDPQPTELGEPSADGSVQVAGLDLGAGRKVSRKILKEIMEPLTKPGAKMEKDVIIDAPIAEPEARVEVPVQEAPTDYTASGRQEPRIMPEPVSEEKAAEIMAARGEAMDAPRTAPSPTPAQKEAGVEKGRVNTTFYSSDELNATIQAVSKDLPPVGPRTIQSLYDDASERGVATNVLDQMFKGKPMTSAIGGDELAKRMAALVTVHDASLLRIDEMMAKAQAGQLAMPERVKLREALAQHDIIVKELSGAKTDIARSMNVFKGAGEGAQKNLSITEQRRVLEQFGGDEQLRILAEKWMTMPNAKAKNKMVEVGLYRKTIDAIIYTAQSTLLTDPNTHLFNGVGTAALIGLDFAERTAAATVISPLLSNLEKLIGKQRSAADKFQLADIGARAGGIKRGIIDGWSMMGEGFMQRDVQARDVQRSALSSEYLSNTPYMKFRGKVLRTGELKGTMVGRAIDMMGAVHSVPMRFIAAADGFFGGIAQRIELHEQAQRYGVQKYIEALDAGDSAGTAMEKAQHANGRLLSQQPADIAASVEGFRRIVTLQEDIDKNVPMANMYIGMNRGLNMRGIKLITLFNRTLVNIANQGMSRTPLAPMSAQFWSDVKRGGRYKDLAISRMALGSSMLIAGWQFADDGRVTGPGPIDLKDKDTLTSMGWQPFALRLQGEHEVSTPTIERFKSLLGEDSVSQGTGEFDGDVFVSLRKIDPASTPLLVGAAMRNAMFYSDYDDDDEYVQKMFAGAAGGMYQMAASFPQTQLIAKLYRVVSSQKTGGDEAEKLTRVFDEIMKTYASTVMAGTPIAGLTNGALSARFERYLDPGQSETAINQAQVEAGEAGLFGVEALSYDPHWAGFRAFGEAYNQWMSRTPFSSRKLQPRLNEFGEEIVPDIGTLYNFGPRMRAGVGSWEGKKGELKSYLSMINHGITRLPQKLTLAGHTLTAEQRIRYIQLYANDIRLKEFNNATLAEAIMADAADLIDETQKLGIDFPFGEAQKSVNGIVAQYRLAARERMFGTFITDEKFRLVDVSPKARGRDMGLPDDIIEYPEISKRMAEEKRRSIFTPK